MQADQVWLDMDPILDNDVVFAGPEKNKVLSQYNLEPVVNLTCLFLDLWPLRNNSSWTYTSCMSLDKTSKLRMKLLRKEY